MLTTSISRLSTARLQGIFVVAFAGLSAPVFACQLDCEGTEALPAYLSTNPTQRALGLGQLNTISEAARAGRGAVAGGTTAGLNITGLAGAAGGSRWNAWTALSSNSVAYGFAPLASDGTANNLLAGFDYSYDSGILAGVAFGSDNTRASTRFNAGSVNSRGYSVAPYLMVPFGSNWTLDGSIGFGSGNVDANVGGGVGGSTTERRSFGALGLTYATMVGKWQLEANGGLLNSSSVQQQYRLSNATVVAAATNSVTQVRAGWRATYGGAGNFAPYFGAALSNDIDQTTVAAVGGQSPVNARQAVTVQAGISFNPGKRVSGSIQLNSEFREQTRNNGIVATLSLKF